VQVCCCQANISQHTAGQWPFFAMIALVNGVYGCLKGPEIENQTNLRGKGSNYRGRAKQICEVH
jgi:hypothetical protein